MEISRTSSMIGAFQQMGASVPADTAVKAEAAETSGTKNASRDKQNAESNKFEPGNLKEMTESLNKFMQALNADLQFEIHEETQQLMVKLVNVKENKVLKEFPPRDFLDMVAKIREYVGALLDKRV